MSANPIEFGATSDASQLSGTTSSASPTQPQSEISNLKSEIPESAIRIPQSAINAALAHAERSYPTSDRPKCPTRAKLWDYYKQHCIEERTRIELERFGAGQTPAVVDQISPASSSSAPSVSSVVPEINENNPRPETPPQSQPFNPETPSETAPKHPETLPQQLETSAEQPGTKPETPETSATPEIAPGLLNSPPTTSTAEIAPHSPTSESHSSPLSPTRAGACSVVDSQPAHSIVQSEIDALAIDFHERLTNKSPFDSLTEDQQATLFELINQGDVAYNQILAFIAQPPPVGFGIPTVKASLTRFKQRFLKRRRQQLKQENLQHVREVLLKCNLDNVDDAHLPAAERILGIRLLRTTADPDSSMERIHAIARTLNSLRKQSLAERKQSYAECRPLGVSPPSDPASNLPEPGLAQPEQTPLP